MTQTQKPIQTEPTWSDVLRFHDKVQQSKHDLEKQLEKERQSKYKEELDNFVKSQHNEKQDQRRHDETLRDRHKMELEEHKEQERLKKLNMRQIASDMAEMSLRESQIKQERERQLKELETYEQRKRFQMIAEQDKNAKLEQKAKKNAISQDLVRSFEQGQQMKAAEQLRQKELDKYYSESYTDVLESQEAARRKFLNKLKFERRQHEGILDQYNRIHHEDLMRKHQLDRSIIDKGLFEKNRREDEAKLQKDLEKEHMKHSTIDVLKLQMEEKRKNERKQRELEIQQYNEHLERSRKHQEIAQQRSREQQEHVKRLNRETLLHQMEEHRRNKRRENMISPLEGELNYSDLQKIKSGVDPQSLISAPSIVPGRNIHFERKLQNYYVNKSLNVDHPPTQALRPGASTTDREYPTILAAEPNDRSQSVTRNSPPPRNQIPYGALRQSADFSQAGPELRNYAVQMDNLKHSPIPRGQSNTPHPYIGQDVYSSPSRYDPLWKKDYLFIKNKNGPYSNPINIITNEYKAYSNAL